MSPEKDLRSKYPPLSRDTVEKIPCILPIGTKFRIKLVPVIATPDPNDPYLPKREDLGAYISTREIMLGRTVSRTRGKEPGDPATYGFLLTSPEIMDTELDRECAEISSFLHRELDTKFLNEHEIEPDQDFESIHIEVEVNE